MVARLECTRRKSIEAQQFAQENCQRARQGTPGRDKPVPYEERVSNANASSPALRLAKASRHVIVREKGLHARIGWQGAQGGGKR